MALIERRKLERFPLKLTASFSALADSGEIETWTLHTQNICADGAFALSGNLLPPGTAVQLDIALPLDKFKDMAGKVSHVRVSGQVVRTEEEGMAIAFGGQSQIFSS